MNVLSLFDGMSCGQIALERIGVNVDNYYACEIDKHAIKVTQNNYPNTIQLGDVSKIDGHELGHIDLLIGGSPCQGFSVAGKQLNFDDPRSKLFFEYVRILGELRETNPNIKFLLENVKMKKEWQDIISEYLGVQPIAINSRLVSGQNRPRLYWTNIEGVEEPEDKGIVLRDILVSNPNSKYNLSGKAVSYMNGLRNGKPRWEFHHNHLDGKASCLTANMYKGVPYGVVIDERFYLSEEQLEKVSFLKGKKEIPREKNGFKYTFKEGAIKFPNDLEGKSQCLVAQGQSISRTTTYVQDDIGKGIRRLTPVECERLQTVPDNYTDCVSDTQRYKMLGNGWTVDVIAHILKNIEN